MLPGGGGSTSTPSRTTRRQIQSARNPPRTTYSAPRSTPSYSGGGGGGGYVAPRKSSYTPSRIPSGGPGVAPRVSAPSRPTVPKLGSFLKRDTGYQQTLRELALNWTNFLADKSRQTGAAKTQFGQQGEALETQRTRDLSDINADFASRGLLHSGLLASRLGDYQKDYLANKTSYQTQYDDFLRQLTASQTQLKQQQGLERERSRQGALARRATKYGL